MIGPPLLRCACLPCSPYRSSTPLLPKKWGAKRPASRTDGPLMHFASTLGEKCRLTAPPAAPDRSGEKLGRRGSPGPRRAAARLGWVNVRSIGSRCESPGSSKFEVSGQPVEGRQGGKFGAAAPNARWMRWVRVRPASLRATPVLVAIVPGPSSDARRTTKQWRRWLDPQPSRSKLPARPTPR